MTLNITYNNDKRIFKIDGLDNNKKYQIEGYDKAYYGSILKHAGLLIERPFGDFESKIIHLVEEY